MTSFSLSLDSCVLCFPLTVLLSSSVLKVLIVTESHLESYKTDKNKWNSFAALKWFTFFFVKYLVILCETLYNMYAVGCSVSAQGEPRGAKASGDRSHVTMVAGIGLVQMWHQRASHSLPPPLSLPAVLSRSPPRSLSLSLSVPLCFFFFFFFFYNKHLPFHTNPPNNKTRV